MQSLKKLIFGFKYDIKNLVKFHPTTQKSANFTSMGSLCPKYIRFELNKNTEELSFITLNNDTKFEYPDLANSKMAWGLGVL